MLVSWKCSYSPQTLNLVFSPNQLNPNFTTDEEPCQYITLNTKHHRTPLGKIVKMDHLSNGDNLKYLKNEKY